MAWGRGGFVGINAEIHRHNKALEQAAEILAHEHGIRHKPGERKDLCQLCKSLPASDDNKNK